MGFLIEYNNSRYLLVELMGSAAKHRILPAIRVERKDQNTGMTLIWLGLTTTYIYIYIYISSYKIQQLTNQKLCPVYSGPCTQTLDCPVGYACMNIFGGGTSYPDYYGFGDKVCRRSRLSILTY